MDKQEWIKDPRFVDHKARGANADLLDGLISEWTVTMTAVELSKHLEDNGVVVGRINTIADVATDPHYQARNMIRREKDDFFGEIALLKNAPRTATVIAESFCEVLILHSSDFTKLLSENLSLKETIEKVAEQRLSK